MYAPVDGAPRSPRPVAIDLYCGAGGLSLGMEKAGFDILGAAEYDPIHALTHKFNFPDAPMLCSDLTDVDPRTIRDLAEQGWAASGRAGKLEIDAIVGGPPCQGFSVGGVRDSEDERNAQLVSFVRVVVALRPKTFLLENVAGLLEPRFDELRQTVRDMLERVGGYRISGLDRPVNAVDFGVPQSRRRLLIVGSLSEVPEIQPAGHDRTSVRDALDGLPDVATYRRLLKRDHVELSARDLARLYATESRYARRLSGLEPAPLDFGYPRRRPVSLLTNSLRTVHSAQTIRRFSRTAPGSVEKISRLYRLDMDGVSRTLRAGTGSDRGSHTSPRPIHPTRSRVITVREGARLHGYPDWFRFHATNWHGHRQLGNSVPPDLAAAAGRAMLKSIGVVPRHPDRGDVANFGDEGWLVMSRAEAMRVMESHRTSSLRGF